MQNRADCDKVERRTWRLVTHDIEFPHFEIAAGNPVHQIGPDVRGNDSTNRSDALREPLRQRAVAGTDRQAMPPGRNARLQQVKLARGVEQVRHQPQACRIRPEDHVATHIRPLFRPRQP